MTSYAVPVETTLKFSLAPSALASNNLKFRLKRRKIAKICVRAFGAPKNRSVLSVRAVLPPSGKIPAGAHAHTHCSKRHHACNTCTCAGKTDTNLSYKCILHSKAAQKAVNWEYFQSIWGLQFHWLVGVATMFLHPANHERVLPGGGTADETLQVARVDH